MRCIWWQRMSGGVWRCLYRFGSNNPKHREELLPGCSEDIGGGLKASEQKPSAELCRVALHRMYREAAMAGVPFPDFQTLQQVSETVASNISSCRITLKTPLWRSG